MVRQKCPIGIFRWELRACKTQSRARHNAARHVISGADRLRRQIGPPFFFWNSRLGVRSHIGVGPAVKATLLQAGEEVGPISAASVRSFHRRPQLRRAGIKTQAHRVAKAGSDHLVATSVGIITVNGCSHFRVACDQIGGRANCQISCHRARRTESSASRAPSKAGHGYDFFARSGGLRFRIFVALERFRLADEKILMPKRQSVGPVES